MRAAVVRVLLGSQCAGCAGHVAAGASLPGTNKYNYIFLPRPIAKYREGGTNCILASRARAFCTNCSRIVNCCPVRASSMPKKREVIASLVRL